MTELSKWRHKAVLHKRETILQWLKESVNKTATLQVIESSNSNNTQESHGVITYNQKTDSFFLCGVNLSANLDDDLSFYVVVRLYNHTPIVKIFEYE